jgi:hypothetical protein
MQPLCNLLAVTVFDREPRHSSVPAKSRSAAARNGGHGRSPGRCALACLPGKTPSTAASVSSSERRFRCDRSESQWTF